MYKNLILGLLFLLQGDDNLMKAVENELNRSIKRHLESGGFVCLFIFLFKKTA